MKKSKNGVGEGAEKGGGQEYATGKSSWEGSTEVGKKRFTKKANAPRKQGEDGKSKRKRGRLFQKERLSQGDHQGRNISIEGNETPRTAVVKGEIEKDGQ